MKHKSMAYPSRLPLQGQEPSMYIGKQPFYIGFVGVKRETSEETPISEHTDKTNIADRTARFAKGFNQVKRNLEENKIAL